MKRYWLKTALLLILGAFLWSGKIQTVHAEGAEAYFGTDGGYTWEAGKKSDIGLYLESLSGGRLEHVNLLVTYDPQVLEFNSAEDVGVTVLSEGAFVLERDGNWNGVFKQILHFTPLISTHTTIEISSASGRLSGGAGREAAGGDNAGTIDALTGEISTDAATRTEVEIPLKSGCELEGIYIDDTRMEDFDTRKFLYDIHVESGMEALPVRAMAVNDGAEIEISDNTLTVGENIVDITVTNREGLKALYRLIVTREAGAEGLAADISEDDADSHKTGAASDADLQAGSDSPGENAVKDSDVNSVEEKVSGIDEDSDTLVSSELAVRKAVNKRRLADNVLKGMLVLIGVLLVAEIILLIVRFKRSRLKKPKFVLSESYKKKARRQELFDNRPPVVIQALHVCMDFDRAVNEYTSIKELAIQTVKGQRIKEKYRALDDISFDIRKGSIVGVIGTNGAGKSTLLKIISGALSPTSGMMRVNKNKVQILTLGTGFDMELTGKENVYLNGAIIGYNREFIDEHYEQIVEFAELEDFMNEKVKNYSSGMVSRLGFAIATAGPPPEILILDEVLSVGDQLFRKKSLKRIKELIHGGSTVLMVSHSTSTIKENCDKAIWLEKGHMIAMGDAVDICDMYDKYDGDLEKIMMVKGKEREEDVLEWIG